MVRRGAAKTPWMAAVRNYDKHLRMFGNEPPSRVR